MLLKCFAMPTGAALLALQLLGAYPAGEPSNRGSPWPAAVERYETEWRLNPPIYQEDRCVYDKDISDLMDVVEQLKGESPASAGERRHEYGAVESPSTLEDSENGSSAAEDSSTEYEGGTSSHYKDGP